MQVIPNTTNWNDSAAFFALIIAIITPAITLLLNNIHQRKLKKLEIKYKSERDYYHLCKLAYEDFIKQASSYILYCCGDGAAYYRAYNNLFLYVPAEYWKDLGELDQIMSSPLEDKSASLNNITKTLAWLLREQRARIPK